MDAGNNNEITILREGMLKNMHTIVFLKNELEDTRQEIEHQAFGFFKSIIEELDIAKDDLSKAPLQRLLTKYEVKKLNPPHNILPDFIEILETVQDINEKDGKIIGVVQDGYVLGNKVVRHTGVRIIKNN